MSEDISRKNHGTLAVIIAVSAVVGFSFGELLGHKGTPKHVSSKVEQKIRDGFPNTKFVDFNQTEYGLIEGLTASNIYYFDQKGKIAIVGELLDLENKVAITVERRRNLKRFMDLDGSALAADAAPAAKPSAPSKPAARAASKSVSVSELPRENYVVHNEGAGKVLYVVSDFNCGFCNKLHQELKGVKDLEIREIPVRFLRDDSTLFGAHALCAEDGQAASEDIFAGKRQGIKTCDEGVDAVGFNTQWASDNGLTGTPTLITEDGRVSSGYRELSRVYDFVNS